MRKIEEKLNAVGVEKFKVEKYQFVEARTGVFMMRWEGVTIKHIHILISQFDMQKTNFNFEFVVFKQIFIL